MFLLMALVVPIVAFCILKPSLFNGWRHFYFIFPFILILSGFILKFFSKKKIIVKQLMILIVVINTILIRELGIFKQCLINIYFSIYLQKNLRENFWVRLLGSFKFRSLLKYLLNMNTSERIHITTLEDQGLTFRSKTC